MTLELTKDQQRLVLQSLENESHKYWKLSKQWDWKTRETEFGNKHKSINKLISYIKDQTSTQNSS